MKSALFAFAAAIVATSPLAAQTSEGPQPQPMPPPIAAPQDIAYPGVLKLEVDATDTQRRIFQIRETIPLAAPGPVTLLYPQWVPGGHSPRNAIYNMAGLVIRANGQVVPWTRDPVQVFAFHVTPPPGATSLQIEFQYLSPTAADQGRVVMTPEMLNAQWLNLAMYPAGYFSRRIQIEPSIRLPAGWGYGTALETAGVDKGLTRFKPIDFDTLMDSPMFAGRYFKRYDLDTSGKSPVRLNIVADRQEALDAATPQQIELHRELIRQADRLYGARHYDHYDFLLALSDRMGGIGLEHHRSSENGTESDYFTDWSHSAPARNLLPHEYNHSWDGKFRRPADLWTPNFNVPMRDSLLWVYEGQDQFWGFVLGARSGLVSRQQTLDALAMTAATYTEGRPGRDWRSVADTTNDPIIAGRRAIPWTSYQRSEDYYSEGQLIWLDADTLIREKSGGKKSLDDFARAFFGMRDGSWTPLTYTFEDVVAALNAVQPYDWATFLDRRARQVSPAFPLDGLTRGGYRLVYTDTPTDYWRDNEANRKIVDLTFSIGLTMKRDATIAAVLWDSPAFKAGLSVSDTILAVNGIAYDAENLKTAIQAAKAGKDPIRLIVKDGDHFRVIDIDYRGGLRYPRLERIAGTPDLLSKLYEPLK